VVFIKTEEWIIPNLIPFRNISKNALRARIKTTYFLKKVKQKDGSDLFDSYRNRATNFNNCGSSNIPAFQLSVLVASADSKFRFIKI
jgi:hypothetical protein